MNSGDDDAGAKGDGMSTITTTDGTEIFYKDWGSGQPIVFSHGWPLSADDWDAQMMFFLQNGYRVIAHDRRGHLPVPSTAHPLALGGRLAAGQVVRTRRDGLGR
jgi:pimeloyl-ACP methyl ester carboxylesterase